MSDRLPLYDSEMVELAFLSTLKFIVLSGNSARHLISALAQGSHQDTVRVFSGVIQLWLECVSIQTHSEPNAAKHSDGLTSNASMSVSSGSTPPVKINEDPRLYGREKADFFDKIVNVDKYLYNIIKFATDTAGQSMTIRRGMLDAGCLSLVLSAFANDDFKLPGLTDAVWKQARKSGIKSGRKETVVGGNSLLAPIPSAVINAEASKLSVLMRNAKFRAAWQGQRFDTRRSLCLSLVDNLLGDGDRDMDDAYSVTRALFKTILEA